LNLDLDTNPDPAFLVNPDMDTDTDPDPNPIRIQAFDDQKLKKKNIDEKFLDQKLLFTFVQAPGEDFSPQKRTSSTSKNKIYQLFSMFVGHFCPPESTSLPLRPA
jgi:hypothetical protein